MSGEANVFNTFSFNKWADGKKEEEIDRESRRRRTEQIKRLKERLKRERALREAGYGDMDLEALIECLQMGEDINSGIDLKWGGYQIINGEGGPGGRRKMPPLPPELQPKGDQEQPIRKGPPSELTDDYILQEIRQFKKGHPTKESLDEAFTHFKNDPRSWIYNRRYAEGAEDGQTAGDMGAKNPEAARPRTGVTITSQEADFISDLLQGYDNSIRPVYNETTITNVSIIPNSLTLLIVDQAEETVSFAAEFVLQWKDEFLSWNKTDKDGQTWVKIKESLIWVPDTTVSTSIDKTDVLGDSEKYVDVKYDGTIRQSIYAIYTNLCNMKVDRFPYDSQICRIGIGPWAYTAREVWVTHGQNIAENAQDFEGNSEWDFKGINASLDISTDPDVGFNYTEISFWLRLKRRPTFYVWVLLIPTYIISTVSIFGLFIPTNNLGEREERVNLGLTTLLSSAVILQIVADAMPKTSALPLLGNFILAEIFVVALGVLCSIVVLSFHNRAHTREWKPPDWILTILNLSGSKKFLSGNTTKIKAKQSIDEGIIYSYTGEG